MTTAKRDFDPVHEQDMIDAGTKCFLMH